MMKGPVPEKAIQIAMPVALSRGFVISCRRSKLSGIDFVIVSPGLAALVCICRTKQLNASVEDLAAQFRTQVGMLQRIPSGSGLTCEVWACDYYDNFRFFRLTGTGRECLAEIGRDGNPLPMPAPSRLSERAPGASDPIHQGKKVPA